MSTATEQNKAVIRRFMDAWNSREPEAFEELVAPDVVRHCQATPGLEVRSLDQLKGFLHQDTEVFPDSVQTIKHLVAEGNLVAAWVTYEGTQRGQMGPFPPSGARAQFDFGAVFRVDRGKIAEWWVTWDNMTVLRALGHPPAG
jgi:steroid delta-isomerase-like uncharacterized protein